MKKAGAPLHQGMRALRTAVWAAAILLAARQTRRSTRQAVDGICTALTRRAPACACGVCRLAVQVGSGRGRGCGQPQGC